MLLEGSTTAGTLVGLVARAMPVEVGMVMLTGLCRVSPEGSVDTLVIFGGLDTIPVANPKGVLPVVEEG